MEGKTMDEYKEKKKTACERLFVIPVGYSVRRTLLFSIQSSSPNRPSAEVLVVVEVPPRATK